MKRIVSLALALLICFSLALPAMAATDSPEKKPTVTGGNPKTGDQIALWVGTMAVSGAGLASVCASRKKEQ